MRKINNIQYNVPIDHRLHENKHIKRDWYSADYHFEYDDDQTLLHVSCKLVERDNYHLSINGKNIVIILAEKKEINRPIYIHHFGKNIMRATEYERLRSINIPLPARDFYIRHSSVDQNHHQLIISLGKTHVVRNNSKETIIND
jgi:hypothetical protein